MIDLVAGASAPRLTLATTSGPAHIPDPAGRAVLLMFFQEAETPVCTAQVASVVREEALIAEFGAVAVCVSTDSIGRLRTFAAAVGANQVDFASDEAGEAARAYGVYDEAQRRARRAAFVIDGTGTIRLALPWYNPLNSELLAQVFQHLGHGDGAGDATDG